MSLALSRGKRAYNKSVQDTKLVVVKSCGSRPEAELIKGALEEAGIQAIIQGDTVGGMREHLAWSGAGLKFSCGRKMQPRRAICSIPLRRATKVPTRNPKLTTTLSHPGAA